MKAAESVDKQVSILKVMRDAAFTYPDNHIFFYELIKSIRKTNLPEETLKAAGSFSSNKIRFHILQSIYYNQVHDFEQEQEEIFHAFDHGLGLFSACKTFDLQINQRPYYGRLMTDFASYQNNTFIPANFNKEKMTSFLDAVYCSIPEYRSATGGAREVLDISRRKEYARSLGNVEEYLDLLEQSKKISEAISFEVLDKIECLFILKRHQEAVSYARKIVANGHLKIQNSSSAAHVDYANRSIRAIYNIAGSLL